MIEPETKIGLCEAPDHVADDEPGVPPETELFKFFYRRTHDGRPCFDWRCDWCLADVPDLEEEEQEQFEGAIHCQPIPGLEEQP